MRQSLFELTATTKISLFVEKSWSKDTAANDISKRNREINNYIFNFS